MRLSLGLFALSVLVLVGSALSAPPGSAATPLAALLPAAAGTPAAAAVRPGPGRGFVTRHRAAFRLGGRPFRFVGFNLYDAAATAAYSCNPSTQLSPAGLDRAFAQVRAAGGTVVRFWATQAYTAGGTDWSGVDRVLATARRHGLKVVPVLEDGPGDCSTGPHRVPLAQADDGHWYSAGYTRPYGTARLSYRDYAQVVARHYRARRTIAAWMLVNEAETSERTASGRSTLVGFARDVAGVVHRADRRHLVTLGTQANGAPGTSGRDFGRLYRLRGLDFAEVHDWAWYGADDQAMPGARPGGRLPRAWSARCRALDAQIACSFAISRRLGKPLVVGEAGIAAGTAAGRSVRARLLRAKLRAAFRAGADGYLLWQLNVANTDGYGFLVGSDDPAFAMMRRQARQLG